MRLPQVTIEARLMDWPVARLASISGDGVPHQVPIVFARLGDVLWSPVDAKPKSGVELSRVRNVRGQPRVSVLLDEYQDDWTQLWWIRVDADARVHQSPLVEASASFLAARDALQRKYPQYADVPLEIGTPTLIELRIRAVRSWCAGTIDTPV